MFIVFMFFEGAALGTMLGWQNIALADLPQGRSVPLDQRDRVRGPAGVNKPELLPPGRQDFPPLMFPFRPCVTLNKILSVRTVIDLQKMLLSSAVTRLEGKIASLEKDTGIRIRVLTQVSSFYHTY